MKRPEDLHGETVLYGCLNWGSGHVARSIPLMQQLLLQGNRLVIWCTPEQRTILERYTIAAVFVEETLFTFRFRGDGNFTKEMLRNISGFRRAVLQQRKVTTLLVKQFGITTIVSDHCYGLVHPEIPSFFITHQVKLPGNSGGIAQFVHRKWMSRFRTIWIMDDADLRLAGNLSQSYPNAHYIGLYSRFSGMQKASGGGIVAVISGPEPYAEQLFRLIVQAAEKQHLSLSVVASQDYGMELPASICLIRDWKEADEAILKADLVISRNGYTTLMDLSVLGKQAVLIPTPGQTEQMYLTTLRKSSEWKIVPQDKLLSSLSF